MDRFVASLEQMWGQILWDFGEVQHDWLLVKDVGLGPVVRFLMIGSPWASATQLGPGLGQCDGFGCNNQVCGPAVLDHAGLCSFDSSSAQVGCNFHLKTDSPKWTGEGFKIIQDLELPPILGITDGCTAVYLRLDECSWGWEFLGVNTFVKTP